MELREQLKEIVGRCPGQMGLAVRHLERSDEYLIGADERFPTASVFKVPLVLELAAQVREGRLALTDCIELRDSMKSPGSGVLKELAEGARVTVRDLAMLAIIVSDNTATDILMGLTRGSETIRPRMQALGLQETSAPLTCKEMLVTAAGLDPADLSMASLIEAGRRLKDENYDFSSVAFKADLDHNNISTPRDLMHLFTALQTRSGIAPADCDFVLDLCARQQLNDRLPLLLPHAAQFAHKTGSLGWTRNDAGILYLPDGHAVVICAMTQRVPFSQLRDANLAMAEAAKAVWDHYTQ